MHHCKRFAKSLKLVRSMKHSSQDSNECFFLLLSPLCLFFSLSFTLHCSKNFTFSSTCGVHHCKRFAKSLKLVRSMKHSSQDSNECFFLLLSLLCLFFSLCFTLVQKTLPSPPHVERVYYIFVACFLSLT